MENSIIDEEDAILTEVSSLAATLWKVSTEVSGSNRDPKMFSIMLFKRLWSNHRGYVSMHDQHLSLEADIILRSGLEAAICIAANYHLREGFLALLKQDAAHTLLGQIKVNRESGATELVKEGEAILRQLKRSFPADLKPSRLNWKDLAERGKTPELYRFHRMLSGISSHVTGMSILKGVVAEDSDSEQTWAEFHSLTRRMHLMMMIGATLQGSMLHSAMIGEDKVTLAAKQLAHRLDIVSVDWPKH